MPTSIEHRQRGLAHQERQELLAVTCGIEAIDAGGCAPPILCRKKHPLGYRDAITRLLPKSEPRHIEAWMRSAHGTLDHLSRDEFSVEARKAHACADEAGPDMSEQLARSHGL